MSQRSVDAIIELGTAADIPRRQVNGFLVCDLLGDLLAPQFGDQPNPDVDAFNVYNPTITDFWGQHPQGVKATDLSAIRFLQNGEALKGASKSQNKGEVCGYFITPRYAPLDSRIGANAERFIGTNTSLHWKILRGKFSTVAKLDTGGGLAIRATKLDNGKAIAQSQGTIPANRGFVFSVEFLSGKVSNAVPTYRFIWGSDERKFALKFAHAQPIILERFDTTTQNPTWKSIANLQGSQVNTRGEKYRVKVMRIAGRLVIDTGDKLYWFFDATSKTNATTHKVTTTTREFSWDTGHWQVECYSLYARTEVAVLKWSQANGAPLTGTLTRPAPRATGLPEDATLTSNFGGWLKTGKTKLSVTHTENTTSYVIELTGGKDGIDTPFVDKVVLQYAPTWTAPLSHAINVRNCCDNLSISLGNPPVMAGSEATIVLDRIRLGLYHPGWENHTAMWNPVRISLKRAGNDYARVFQGYIFKPSTNVGAYREHKLTLALRDSIVRLQKTGDLNHAPVDHRYPPLDVYFARKQSTGNSGYDGYGVPNDPNLYGGECVREILRIALGDAVAESINGNGDYKRFIASDHPPMLSASTDRAGWLQINQLSNQGGESQPLSSGTFNFPPPFGQAALDWINDIAKQDRCVFFFGWPDGDTSDWPVPIYGRLLNIINAGVPIHTINELPASFDNALSLLKQLDSERRPERDVNRVLVWGQEASGLQGLLPSLRMSETRLPDSDPRSAANSWERTLIVREPLATFAPEAIGAAIIQGLTGVDLQWPTLPIEPGDERIGVGHLLHLNTSHLDNSLDGHYMRAERVDHAIDFSKDTASFTTTIQPRPLTAQEAAQL